MKAQQQMLTDLVQAGDVDKLRKLLNDGCEVSDWRNNSILHTCCYAPRRRAEMARLLIQKGANINATDDFGERVIYVAGAMIDPDIDLCRVLLNAGVRITALNNKPSFKTFGLTALHGVRHPSVGEMLLEYGFDLNSDEYFILPLGAVLDNLKDACDEANPNRGDIANLIETAKLMIRRGSPVNNLSTQKNRTNSVEEFVFETGLVEILSL